MTLKIGTATFATRRPTDLDAQLVNATGCSSAEIDHLLASGPDRVAAAALPFILKDAPSLVDLARAIAADPAAIEQVRALYANLPDAPAPNEEA